MNSDVLTEIFLHLPAESLVSLKTVCKLWRHVIDSSVFRKLYTRNCNNNHISDDNDKVQLEFSVLNRQVCVKINNQSFIAHRPVKGLICICTRQMVPIAICNLFLGQLKFLPSSTYPGPYHDSCQISYPDVVVGFSGDNFKVVQLMLCRNHNRLHAQLYSRKMHCWRELGGDGVVDDVAYNSVIPIKSFCKNGQFAHWRLSSRKRKLGGDFLSRIVSFDMKNEVFRIIRLPPDYAMDYESTTTIFAKDENSFQLFDLSTLSSRKSVTIYESTCEGRELSWNDMKNVEVKVDLYDIRDDPWRQPWWTTGCVILELYSSVFVYDYRDRKFIFKLYGFRKGSQSFEYGGNLVSLATICDYHSLQFKTAKYYVDMIF